MQEKYASRWFRTPVLHSNPPPTAAVVTSYQNVTKSHFTNTISATERERERGTITFGITHEKSTKISKVMTI
jgi:hypothetical protein